MHDLRSLLDKVLGLSVSRETLSRLEVHLEMLRKWNPAINLVSSSTLSSGWERHICDSAQLLRYCGRHSGHWLDFGTGGGFPGLVCAIIAQEISPEIRFTFVESDKRKCAFLTNMAQLTSLGVEIIPERIESLDPQCADIISARAVSSLDQLIGYALPHLAEGGTCIFPKGEHYRTELDAARHEWRFKLSQFPSITDPKAAILVLGDVERA
ncbi:MAG: 16S rRNA (guanine(527)-N(7))-methyltransferase RsmG [Tropicimonas sp.]|uniref:16S rRNA (guanine(527)-N(7))-methyltransferase RsmG n=1 Tax=Tropicimonas sp. TaxID=2067044 RepID=UPI003A8A97D3